jgi:hypothetical protein
MTNSSGRRVLRCMPRVKERAPVVRGCVDISGPRAHLARSCIKRMERQRGCISDAARIPRSSYREMYVPWCGGLSQ